METVCNDTHGAIQWIFMINDDYLHDTGSNGCAIVPSFSDLLALINPKIYNGI